MRRSPISLLAGAAFGAWWLVRTMRTRRGSLAGQVALVTGGSRGLGFLVARDLVRGGCRVAICARDAEELERARRSLTRELAGRGETGSKAFVLALPCDVSDAGDPADARWFSAAARAPGLAMRADRAARRIVAALARRQARAVLGAPAKLLHLANDLFPSVTSAASSVAHRILPESRPAR